MESLLALVFLVLMVLGGISATRHLKRGLRRLQQGRPLFGPAPVAAPRPPVAPPPASSHAGPASPRRGVPPPPPTVPLPPRFQPGEAGVPASLPLRPKQYFLARSELAFLASLEAALPPGYRVFPNVRLNDIFFIATRHPGQQRAAYARLRDKHVDFLVVVLPELRPVLAVELDGDSHDTDAQRYRDAVKDVAFASAGLPLVRARVGMEWTPEAVQAHIEGSVARR